MTLLRLIRSRLTRLVQLSRTTEESGQDWLVEPHKLDSREWWLSWTAVAVTLVLTMGIAVLAYSMLSKQYEDFENFQMVTAVRGLVGLVLLFDIYAVYQQFQIHRVRRRWMMREQLFRLIGENAADLIAVVDTSGKRLYNSPSYEKVLGYTCEELASTPSLAQVHPDDLEKVKAAGREAMETGKGRRIEYRMRHKDGRWIDFESTASAILDTSGKVYRLVIVNREISERKRLEEQFRQAQKMEAIGRLSGGVAHDFNNLLGLIIGYSEVLQEKIPQEDALRQCVDQIYGAGKRASNLTRQLLAFSRQQVLEPKILSLNDVITDMYKMLCRLIGENIELSIVLDAGLGNVKADQGQIEQVIMNLAVNARDAMPDGGKLQIGTSNTEIDEAVAASFSYPVVPGPYILLTVTDSGVGMDGAIQQKIFEPFFTTKEKGKGTGLGLAMVYGVVKQSGGYIDVKSELGKGSMFSIQLPRICGSAAPDTEVVVNSAQLTGTGTILLVEDEKELRELTRFQLEELGYTVTEAGSGEEALELSRSFSKPVDLLLTDIIMTGMNGRILAQKLTAEYPQMKLVYMSGYTGQNVGVQSAFEPGVKFLQKPFTRDVLAQKIKEGFQSPVTAVRRSER